MKSESIKPRGSMRVALGYSDSDDRMWIRIGDGRLLWWITRRLSLRMISQWAALVERTVPLEVEAATSGADLPAEPAHRAAGEHQSALSTAAQARGGTDREAPPPPGVSALLYSAEISVAGEVMRFTFRSASNRQTFETPRADAHRLLAAFVSRCRRNGWLDSPLPEWLK